MHVYALFVTVALLLSGCGILPLTAEPAAPEVTPPATARQMEKATPTQLGPAATVAQNAPPTPTEVQSAATATQTEQSTATPAVQVTDVPIVEATAEAPAGPPAFVGCRNEGEGILFDYPAGWSVEEEANGAVFGKGSVILIVTCRMAGDTAALWTRTGIPAGDVVVLGEPVPFLGLALTRNGLVYEDRLKMVFYGGHPVSVVETETMEFIITLDAAWHGGDYPAVDIPDDVLAEAEAILSSFEFVKE